VAPSIGGCLANDLKPIMGRPLAVHNDSHGILTTVGTLVLPSVYLLELTSPAR
jgi:hypothetical protein